MAKLIILRGDAPDRELDLGERTVRIGRGDQNDIVLPDPAKSVSRSHAELRFEQGKYIVVDLNSQNGVWAAGRRVPQATLEPGVPVVLGSYRLILKPDLSPVPAPTEVTVVVSSAGTDPATAATMVVPMRPAAPAPPLPLPQAAKPEPKPEAPPTPAPPPKPPAKPEPRPSAVAKPPVTARPAARPTAPARPAGRRISRGLLLGGLAVLLLAALAAAVFLTPLGGQLAGLMGNQPAARPATGPSPAVPDAGAVVPDAAVAAPPADRLPAPPAAPPAAAPLPVERAAPAPPQPTPAAPPAATQRPAATPVVAPARAPRLPPDTPPAPAEPRPKLPNLAQMLEDARSAMNKGDYVVAIAGFEAVVAADPKYPNAADLLGVARGGAKNASQLALDAGNKAETSGDYAGAARQFERSLQLDPESAAAPDAMRQLRSRMQTEGEDAFRRARQYDALGRVQEAISMYEKAVQLLPPDHASVKAARERIAALKGGVQGCPEF